MKKLSRLEKILFDRVKTERDVYLNMQADAERWGADALKEQRERYKAVYQLLIDADLEDVYEEY